MRHMTPLPQGPVCLRAPDSSAPSPPGFGADRARETLLRDCTTNAFQGRQRRRPFCLTGRVPPKLKTLIVMAGLVPAISTVVHRAHRIEIAGTQGRLRPSSRAMPGDDTEWIA